ncbi:unnamed protein product (macronuclear) [Paramecium tetraurelia]|uniref:Uncharacterized protein n=1 Tax=Paramecium tetraurelia TaxID=5888 RepID=A0C1F7_PARTE|nr:uncharacterized protein GSPATT00034100001 [Paramecium tetraurelia]CAK64624.1 unnamed protein product [Paramecium tetraurelia]|eukprot:XP_001432021.1 hypothetical protein (macronuclear) [Paramecium tetraurelia strain d4-2]
MIQNHPLCPKSAMEKYYMEQQLPKYQTLPPQLAQKKNHSYYHDNSNIWNNQHQSSSNMKVFAKIQEQKLRGEKRIKQLQKQEERDKTLYQMSKHIYFNQLKQEDHLRMQTRKLERAGLQNLSQQQSDIEADQLQLKPIQYNTTLQGRPELFWNKVGQHSQKHIKMLVNPKILAMEEEAVKLIEKRIEKEHKVEQIRWELKQENMKLIRKLNAKRQEENDEIHYKAGLSPSHKMGISKTIHVRRPSRPSRPSLDIIEQTLQQIEEKQERTSRPFTIDSDKPSFSLHVRPQTSKLEQSVNQKCAQSSQQSLSVTKKRTLRMDRSEFKGLYLAQACDVSDNNFSKTIRSNCTILKGISNQKIRAQQMPQNIRSTNQPEENVNKMLDSFEGKLQDKKLKY